MAEAEQWIRGFRGRLEAAAPTERGVRHMLDTMEEHKGCQSCGARHPYCNVFLRPQCWEEVPGSDGVSWRRRTRIESGGS